MLIILMIAAAISLGLSFIPFPAEDEDDPISSTLNPTSFPSPLTMNTTLTEHTTGGLETNSQQSGQGISEKQTKWIEGTAIFLAVRLELLT
jgi:hypothetical protein